MQKIISLFQRNYDGDRLVRDEIVPGAEWVIAGEGVATRKFDGTPVLVQDGRLYKRYDVKPGKTAPEGAIKITDTPDPNTGHWPWWVPVGEGNEDKLFREGFRNYEREFGEEPENGTYELVGPRINGNKEGFDRHILIRHGTEKIYFPQGISYDSLKEALDQMPYEGIVWRHPDGRMVKIKKKDFGYKW
jgi:hypothetical protein